MGRFVIRGANAIQFLQHVLTNNVEALDLAPTGAQYTLIPNETGGALDDAFLYRFFEDEYLLVVNAANRRKDWDHLKLHLGRFNGVELIDRTFELAMFALQGPKSRGIMEAVAESRNADATPSAEGRGQIGRPSHGLPEPFRNAVGIASIAGARVMVGRTGYTGEPLCFELFVEREKAPMLWDLLLEKGARPVGLAARDTLRLESSLPLYRPRVGIRLGSEGNSLLCDPDCQVGGQLFTA